jgi:hypothetical protein
MKPINLREHEVKQVLETGRVTVRREIRLYRFKPSNTPGYDWSWRDKCMLRNEATTEKLIKMHSPWSPSDKFYALESVHPWRTHVQSARIKLITRDVRAERNETTGRFDWVGEMERVK